MFKLALDAGHGLYTAGKQTPDGIKEWSLNDEVCDLATIGLKAYGIDVLRTDHNEGYTDESLTARVNEYIAAGVTCVISVHHNAFTSTWNSATGIEVYTDNNPTTDDVKLANLLHAKLVQKTGLKGRGVKKAAFTVINQNKVTAVLCEGGFMDSTNDYKVITSAAGKQAYADAIVEAVVEMYGLTKQSASKPVEPSKSTNTKFDIIYQTWDNINNKWLPNIVNDSDYAGMFGHDVCAIYANLSSGSCTYKVHTQNGKWLPAVTDRSDYAGVFNKPIDAFMIKSNDPDVVIHYQVHTRGGKWLPYITGYNESDSDNGYAGIIGEPIDGIRMYVTIKQTVLPAPTQTPIIKPTITEEVKDKPTLIPVESQKPTVETVEPQQPKVEYEVQPEIEKIPVTSDDVKQKINFIFNFIKKLIEFFAQFINK